MLERFKFSLAKTIEYWPLFLVWLLLCYVSSGGRAEAADFSLMFGANIQISESVRSDAIFTGVPKYSPTLTRNVYDGSMSLVVGLAGRQEVVSGLDLGAFVDTLGSYGPSIGFCLPNFHMGAFVGPQSTYGGYMDGPLNAGTVLLGVYGLRENRDKGFSAGMTLGYHFY